MQNAEQGILKANGTGGGRARIPRLPNAPANIREWRDELSRRCGPGEHGAAINGATLRSRRATH